jgi:hypothetical protein
MELVPGERFDLPGAEAIVISGHNMRERHLRMEGGS